MNFYKKTLSYLFCIVCFSTFSHAQIIQSLTERNDIRHVQLLNMSPLFSEVNKSSNPMKETFLLQQYAEYIRLYERNVTANKNDNELVYDYLVANFYEKHYKVLKEILQQINFDMLKDDQKDNYQLIEAVSIYMDNDEKGLNAYYNEKKEKKDLSSDYLKGIAKLRTLFFIRNNKILNLKDKEGAYLYAVGWNNLLTRNYKEADTYFKSAGLADNNPLIIYTRAMKAMEEKQYSQARALFQAIPPGEFFIEGRFRTIETFIYEYNYVAAQQLLGQFRETYPNDKEYLSGINYYEGVTNFYAGQWNKARRFFSQVAGSGEAHYYLGEIAYRDEDYTEAAINYSQVIAEVSRASSFYPSALYGLAWSQFKLEKFAEAKDSFDLLIRYGLKDEVLKLNCLIKLADCNYNLHYYNEALKGYSSLMNSLEPKKQQQKLLYKLVLRSLIQVYSKLRQFDKANEYLNQYLDLAENNVEKIMLKKVLADNYIKMEMTNEAIAIYEEIIKSYPGMDEDIYINLADAYFNLKNYDKSFEYYNMYVRTYPKGSRRLDARYGSVQSLFMQKKYDMALAAAKEVDEEFQLQLYDELKEKIKFAKEQKEE
ncbi:MAG: tetratricopeptide repeat protein [Candidatus Margulisbacteria bacterium]|nr:tetratricopeptide repeat protein [Candidatus Margulisiibacteriota bacterium]